MGYGKIVIEIFIAFLILKALILKNNLTYQILDIYLSGPFITTIH